jgi:hypothetical protein
MEDFEKALENIEGFCKVLVKKMPENAAELQNKTIAESTEKSLLMRNIASKTLDTDSSNRRFIPLSQIEEPLIDVFEEGDFIRILVQCRCQEQQVTFYTCTDGIKICREECNINSDGVETCEESCQKVNLPTDHLQLENRLFVVAKCNSNKVLDAMIPKNYHDI